MKKVIVIIFGSIALGALLLLASTFIQPTASSVSDGYKHAEIRLKGAIFNVRVADTSALRARGLSGSKPLTDNEGMFFVFDASDRIGFWMKDMLYALDIVWLDTDMKIVHIEKNLSPDTYPTVFYPDKPARYVFEIAAGTTDRLGIQEGDVLEVSGGK